MKKCNTCQHSFYGQPHGQAMGYAWICEMPETEENYCKAHKLPYWRLRWRHDPEFLPQFITKEEFQV